MRGILHQGAKSSCHRRVCLHHSSSERLKGKAIFSGIQEIKDILRLSRRNSRPYQLKRLPEKVFQRRVIMVGHVAYLRIAWKVESLVDRA